MEDIIPEYASILKSTDIGDQFHLIIMEGVRSEYNTIKIPFLEVNITYAQRKIKSLDAICAEKQQEQVVVNQEQLRNLKQVQAEAEEIYPEIRDLLIQLQTT